MLLTACCLLSPIGTSAQPEAATKSDEHAADVAPAGDWRPLPYRAEYRVTRNGKGLAEAQVELQRPTLQHYHFSSQAEGSRGLARLVGFNDKQQARFLWQDGKPLRPLDSSNRFEAAWRDSEWQANYDWDAGRVSGESDDGPFDLPLADGLQDPATINWAILQGVAAGRQDFELPVLDEDKIEIQNFSATELPVDGQDGACGKVLLIERQREESSRFTASWHLPELDYFLVRLDHGKRGGDHYSQSVAALWQDDQRVELSEDCLEAVQRLAGPYITRWLAEP